MAYRNTAFNPGSRYLDAENESLRDRIKTVRAIINDKEKTDEQKVADIKALIR